MISRDGNTISLWQAGVEPYNSQPVIVSNQLYDVVIVGGGITGITTAYLLQKAGKRCLLLEAKNIGFGTTGGTTAHLNTLLDTSYLTIQKNFDKETATDVAQAVTMAIDLIQEHIELLHIDCGFSPASAFLFAQDEEQSNQLDVIMTACRESGLIVKESGQLPFSIPFLKAMEVAGQAKFHPLKYLYGLAKAYESIGGAILQNCSVTGLNEYNNLNLVTSSGTIQAKDIVYATHIPPGVNLVHLRCVPYRSYAMAMELENDQYPENLVYDMADPYHYYRSQEVDGKKYLIAGGKDHRTGKKENTRNCFTELEATIRKNFRVHEIAYSWSSQYYEPADGLPYIGRLPAHPEHVYVATGFGGNGMVYSQVAAIILHSIILEEPSPLINPRIFHPGRLKPVAGFANFVTHNAEVAKSFVGKLFSPDKLSSLRQLTNGEARVVQYNNQKLALYKDEKGILHAVNPVCTHLKCEVNWNDAEKSWDCPCHGARFNAEGEVLNTPADHPLEKIYLGEEANRSERLMANK